MKKILVLSLGFMLAFGGFSFTFAQDSLANTGTTTVNCITTPCPEATTTAFTPTTIATTTSANSNTLNLQCVQTAVATREASMVNAFNAFSTSMSTALSTRATALNTAWGLTDAKARRETRSAAWKAFSVSSKTAKTTFKTSKKSAWNTFKTATKECKVPLAESEGSDLIL